MFDRKEHMTKKSSLVEGIGSCLLTAVLVCLPGVALWAAAFQVIFIAFYSASAFPIFAGLVLIGGLLGMVFLRESRFGGPDRVRSSVLWGARYLLAGSAMGFLVALVSGGYVSTPYAGAMIGGAIGLVCGSLGGSFHGWLATRSVITVKDQ